MIEFLETRRIERYRLIVWKTVFFAEGKRGSDRKQEVDRFGYYQMIMFAIISLPLFLSAGFTLAYVFTAGEVKYRYATTWCNQRFEQWFYFFFSCFSFFFNLRVIYRVYERLLCCSSYSGLVAYSESVSFMARARTNKLWREGLNNARRSSAINEEHLMLRDYMSDRTLNYVIDATDNRLLY